MLNPPEREKYVAGAAVKKLAKPLLSLFEDSSEKAVKSKMNAVHDAVEEAVKVRDTTKMKKADIFRMVAKDQDVTVQDVKNIEKVFAHKAGGGGKENLLGEIGQTIKAKYKNPTELQKIAEDLGGGSTTKEARKSKFDAVATTAGLGFLGSGASYFAGKLSASQEAKIKENKTSTVTDITSGTMDSAFSKASKNPTKYVFMKAGQPHFKYKGKDVPFALATEEDDVVLDMTPRSKKAQGGYDAVKGYKDMYNMFERNLAAAESAEQRRVIEENFLKDTLNVSDTTKIAALKEMEKERMAREGMDKGGLPDLTGDGKITQADVLKGRGVFNEGGSMMMPPEGMPVDTYPNIPEDEMDEALASQLPDDEMEEDYISYVMDESLDDDEQDYLAGVLQNDPRLSDILDKVITVASEFSGAGEVEGPGTGVSDSIPARLSDGEFVFTRKATDQIGADQLQTMMDDAERAYDGGYQMKAIGGYMQEDPEEQSSPLSKTDEEIKKLMMGANKMPSLR
jgi:uncharacterized protein YfkK (UPF0435 family)